MQRQQRVPPPHHTHTPPCSPPATTYRSPFPAPPPYPLPHPQAPSVPCDFECGLESRKQQIASAFGVTDPDDHVAYFDKHRNPTYSPQLIQVGTQGS